MIESKNVASEVAAATSLIAKPTDESSYRKVCDAAVAASNAAEALALGDSDKAMQALESCIRHIQATVADFGLDLTEVLPSEVCSSCGHLATDYVTRGASIRCGACMREPAATATVDPMAQLAALTKALGAGNLLSRLLESCSNEPPHLRIERAGSLVRVVTLTGDTPLTWAQMTPSAAREVAVALSVCAVSAEQGRDLDKKLSSLVELHVESEGASIGMRVTGQNPVELHFPLEHAERLGVAFTQVLADARAATARRREKAS